jgi:hypothetical protein
MKIAIPRLSIVLLVLLLTPYGEASGQDIVELGRRRHASGDSALQDYKSRLNTLVSVGFISDPQAPPKLLVASELAAGVAWDRADGLQIKMLGQRYVTSFGRDVEAGLDFSEPWFVATAPGDSLRLFGSIDLPNRAAVHPFAAGAEEFYEYELGDTVTLLTPGRQVDLIEVRVTPTTGDEALVVGSIWVDEATGDVGAMQIRFVGKPLWADNGDPEGSDWANRILSVSATMQQGLWETRYWLPHRQELELMVRIPFIGNFAIPVIFRNEFGRYDINTGEPIAWVSPDSLRQSRDRDDEDWHGATLWLGPGRKVEPVEADTTEREDEHGRRDDEYPRRDATQVRAGAGHGSWEIIRPPTDSLVAFDEWDSPMETPASELTLPSGEELERRARQLSNDIVGRKLFAIQYDRLPDFIRYNRVESLALGIAARYDLPRRAFWSLGGGFSFGFADLRPKGRLDVRHDAPSMRIDLGGYSELHVAGSSLNDRKRAFGNSLRAFILGRDDADYYRSSGAKFSFDRRWDWLRGRLGVGWEDQRSVERNTQVAIPGLWQDSVFQANPPADEGSYWRGDVEAIVYLGDWTRPTNRAQLTLGLEAGSDADSLDYLQPRVGLEGKVDIGKLASLALIARGGWTSGDAPLQREWRLGGIETVRGFLHGTLRGDSYWTGRVELAHIRPIWRPVIFADFGWAGDVKGWPGGGESGEALWSAGGGVSFLNGFFRTELVFPKFEEVWFEMYFAAAL